MKSKVWHVDIRLSIENHEELVVLCKPNKESGEPDVCMLFHKLFDVEPMPDEVSAMISVLEKR